MELVIPLLGTTEKRGIFYAFTEHPVPAHLHRLLQKKGMIAIPITSTDPRLIVTQVSRHMGFKRMVTMSSFPLTAGAEVTLRFPVVRLRAKSGRMLQLIRFSLGSSNLSSSSYRLRSKIRLLLKPIAVALFSGGFGQYPRGEGHRGAGDQGPWGHIHDPFLRT